VRYSPGWRLAAGAADPSANGDWLTYDFWGVETALRVQGGPYWAIYRVWIDGRPANALPADESGAAYLVLYDPLAEERTVVLARNLPAGRHQARIEAHGGWGQWALRGMTVRDASSRGLSAWLDWRVMFLAAVALAAVWLWLLGRQRAPDIVADTGRAATADENVIARPASFGFAQDMVWAEAIPSMREDCFVAQTAPRNDDSGGMLRAVPPDVLWYGLAAGLTLACVFSRWLLLDLAALAGLGLIFILRPDVSLPFIAFTIPLWPQPKRLVGFEFSLYELLIWLAVGAMAVRWLLTELSGRYAGPSFGLHPRLSALIRVPSLSLRPAGLDWPMLALLATGLAASLAAERSGVALREFRTVFLLAALFYGLVTRVPWPAGRPFSPRPVIYGLLAGMTFVSLVALWQFASGEGRIDVEGVGRVRAFYGSPNNLALVLDRAIPLGLALAAFGAWHERLARSGEASRSEIGQREGGVWARGLLASATGVMLMACVVTYSKGALLLGLPVGLAAVLLGGAWRSRRRWPLWALAGLAVAGGVGLLLLVRTPRFADLTNFDAGTGFFRLKLWQSAWNMLLDHPWFGVGPDNFLYAYRTRYVLPAAWQELNLSHPHNIVLDLGTRLGAIGLLAGLWALAGAIHRAWQLLREGAADTWPLALGLLAGLLATLVHGLIDNSLFLIDLMALFALVVGVMRRIGESANQRPGESRFTLRV
jgi:O-antigen ligase